MPENRTAFDVEFLLDLDGDTGDPLGARLARALRDSIQAGRLQGAPYRAGVQLGDRLSGAVLHQEPARKLVGLVATDRGQPLTGGASDQAKQQSTSS